MKKRSHDEISFWQSTTDILSALLLVTMLVMLLLILYLMHVPQEEWDSYGAYTPTPRPTIMVSTTVYSCWNTFPSISGNAKVISSFMGDPEVMERILADIGCSFEKF